MTTTDVPAATAVRYDKDADGIVILTLDDPESSANTMNDRYAAGMAAAVDTLEADVAAGGVTGVMIASAKKTFFAGGDLKMLQAVRPEDTAQFFEQVEAVKAQLRRIEQIGKPVVAALNGTALGGGLEIALAAHYRIAVDDPKAKFGFPEVTLGLLPGGGGVTRTVRMLGLQSALMDWLLQGQQRGVAAAKEKGLIDEVVATQDELLPAARTWLLEHKDDAEAASQPWDRPGYRMPGGTPSTPKLAQFLPGFPGNLRKQLKGADYPAPRAILSAAVEGAQVDVDTASRIESRYLTSLASGSVSTNMIQAFFFDMQQITSGALRPKGIEQHKVSRVGVLGAGMMGAGIAYACATRGIGVVLKDVSAENAAKGKAYTESLLTKKVDKGRMTPEARQEILDRITATADAADLKGVDAVIEAVFEDADLKAKVFAEVESVVDADTLLCSNTSTLPITSLAAQIVGTVTKLAEPGDSDSNEHQEVSDVLAVQGASDRNRQLSRNFIGLHFFSPVDKMKLVEIIKGEQTSDEALARAIDLVQQIGKLPIVVNDSRGFYTSRVFGTLVLEGVALLEEGVDPATIERAATMAGFPAPPLAMLDEVSLTLTQHIRAEAEKDAAARGVTLPSAPGSAVVDRMVGEFGRKGRAAGSGFYDYAGGASKKLWPGLREHFAKPDADVPLRDIEDRYLFVMALETAKCFEEGVLDSTAAANIGSIFGIGYPPLTGGTAQFIDGYDGGLAGFVARAQELATACGPRFAPSDWLLVKAESGESL